jgi:chromosome segregation ATPase
MPGTVSCRRNYVLPRRVAARRVCQVADLERKHKELTDAAVALSEAADTASRKVEELDSERRKLRDETRNRKQDLKLRREEEMEIRRQVDAHERTLAAYEADIARIQVGLGGARSSLPRGVARQTTVRGESAKMSRIAGEATELRAR